MAHQRLAARLAAGVEAQLPVKRGDLRVQRLGHRYRDGDLLTRSIGQLDLVGTQGARLFQAAR